MVVLNFIGIYLWNITVTIGALLWTVLVRLIRRLIQLAYHIVSGPVFFIIALFHGFRALFNEINAVGGWLKKGLFSMLGWIGRVLGKSLDLIMTGEIFDLIFQIVKPNTRTLSKLEIDEAKKVFGKGLTYWQVRIDEKSLLARLGARFAGSSNMGVTTFHTINFTRKIDTQPGNGDMHWLIHELAHVSQMEHIGLQYIVEALVAQNTGGYNYGGHDALKGKRLYQFNREQQADIAADYYHDVLHGSTPSENYLPLIEEFRNTGIKLGKW